MSDELHIAGGRELDEALKRLPAKMQANIMRAALRAGAAVLRKAVQENVPVQDGALRKSIKVSARIKGDEASAKVTTKLWYAHFVEFGTAMHWIRVKEEERPWRNTRRGPRALSVRTLNRMAKRGSLVIGTHFVGNAVEHPGATAHPFMRPAFDDKAADALKAVAAKIRDRLTVQGINVPVPEPADD